MPRSSTENRLPRRADEIFSVALQQLTDRGYDALTIEGIATESGVNKTTLYRWWRGKDELLSAALRESDLLHITVPDTGSLYADIVETLRQIAQLLESSFTRAIIAGVIDGSRPELARLANDFVDDRLTGHREILQRAKDRGEISQTTTGSELFHPLIGALWIRVLLLRQPVDELDLTGLVDQFLNGFVRADETVN